ncbi:MAG: thiamine pyrophosphate-binding protein [Candidatus Manganitrophus sp. SA1]|nr:thiamine pyrophosphate-binding protein [Candidatus Manganitrophus morganii]
MKVSDYIAGFLHAQGVNHVFEVVGGMTTHLLDSIYRQGKIRIISTHHEQAAAFAVDGISRMTGVPGVAMATSGPGATNLLTGIGSCYFDSSPAIFITGQVNRSEQKGKLPIRQLGFQETDIVAMADPITKASWRVRSADEIPVLLEKAFVLAMSGRPGPVLIDIPMDIQRADIPVETPSRLSATEYSTVPPSEVEKLFFEMEKAQRPLILAGGGIRSAQVGDLFRNFVERLKVPVVNSLMAVDVLPHHSPFRVGMIGTYGNRWANIAVGRSDFLLVLGSRLDIRQTGSDTKAFKGSRSVYHVDCEMGEINNRVTGCYPVQAHLRPFLAEANRIGAEWRFPDRSDWLKEIERQKHSRPDTAELPGVPGINPNELMHQLGIASPQASAYVVDVGQHQMWAAQSLELYPHQRFLTSGGMGAMGFALPAAIGATQACPGQPVVMIAGDGGFQLNIQELQTVIRNHLPIKIIIINNQCHGMVRQFQQSYFDERYQSTFWGYSAPDFAQIATAYGIPSHSIDAANDIKQALEWFWKNPTAPSLLQVMIDKFTNVYPKIAFGLPMTAMEPFAKPVDMEGT